MVGKFLRNSKSIQGTSEWKALNDYLDQMLLLISLRAMFRAWFEEI